METDCSFFKIDLDADLHLLDENFRLDLLLLGQDRSRTEERSDCNGDED